MAINGSCHCGQVRIQAPYAPQWVASCNCSMCRRTGTLMAYYDRAEVTVTGETVPYLTGDRFIETHHCPHCACITNWIAAAGVEERGLSAQDLQFLTARTGINARLLDGFALSEAGPTFDGRPLEVRFRDNAG